MAWTTLEHAAMQRLGHQSSQTRRLDHAAQPGGRRGVAGDYRARPWLRLRYHREPARLSRGIAKIVAPDEVHRQSCPPHHDRITADHLPRMGPTRIDQHLHLPARMGIAHAEHQQIDRHDRGHDWPAPGACQCAEPMRRQDNRQNCREHKIARVENQFFGQHRHQHEIGERHRGEHEHRPGLHDPEAAAQTDNRTQRRHPEEQPEIIVDEQHEHRIDHGVKQEIALMISGAIDVRIMIECNCIATQRITGHQPLEQRLAAEHQRQPHPGGNQHRPLHRATDQKHWPHGNQRQQRCFATHNCGAETHARHQPAQQRGPRRPRRAQQPGPTEQQRCLNQVHPDGGGIGDNDGQRGRE